MKVVVAVLSHVVVPVAAAASGHAYVALAGPVTMHTPLATYALWAGIVLVAALLVAIALLRFAGFPLRTTPHSSFALPQVTGLGLLALLYVAAAAPFVLLATTPLGSLLTPGWVSPLLMGLATGTVVYTAFALLMRQLNLRWLSILPVLIAAAAYLAYAGQLPWLLAVPLVNALTGASVSMAWPTARGGSNDVI